MRRDLSEMASEKLRPATNAPLIPNESAPSARRPPLADPLFDEFWAAYPRKVGKVGAHRAWERITRRGVAGRLIIAAAERFRDDCRARRIEQKFIPHPASWLRDGRYGDEEAVEEPPAGAKPCGPPSPVSDERLLAAVIRLTADQDHPVTAATAIIAAVRQSAPSAAPCFPFVAADRGRELAVMLYADYLQTPEWQARRKVMLRQADLRAARDGRPRRPDRSLRGLPQAVPRQRQALRRARRLTLASQPRIDPATLVSPLPDSAS